MPRLVTDSSHRFIYLIFETVGFSYSWCGSQYHYQPQYSWYDCDYAADVCGQVGPLTLIVISIINEEGDCATARRTL